MFLSFALLNLLSIQLIEFSNAQNFSLEWMAKETHEIYSTSGQDNNYIESEILNETQFQFNYGVAPVHSLNFETAKIQLQDQNVDCEYISSRKTWVINENDNKLSVGDLVFMPELQSGAGEFETVFFVLENNEIVRPSVEGLVFPLEIVELVGKHNLQAYYREALYKILEANNDEFEMWFDGVDGGEAGFWANPDVIDLNKKQKQKETCNLSYQTNAEYAIVVKPTNAIKDLVSHNQLKSALRYCVFQTKGAYGEHISNAEAWKLAGTWASKIRQGKDLINWEIISAPCGVGFYDTMGDIL
eukprot:Pgem_evm2s4776